MRKDHFLLTMALLIFMSSPLQASETPLATAEIESSLDNQFNGSIQVRIKINILKDLIIDGQPLIKLPIGWSAVPEQISLKKTYQKDMSFEVRVLIKYPKNNLPFYPQDISISLPVKAKNDSTQTDLLLSKGKVYFTPYNTVELFSVGDFENANRVWINPNTGVSAVRLKLDKKNIPVSNVNMALDTIGGTDMEDLPIELIYVPGLAYFIPMKLTSDSMLVGDFDDGEDSLSLNNMDKVDALTKLLVAASNGDPIDSTMFLNKSKIVNSGVRIRIRFPKIHIHINVHIPFIPVITRRFTGSVSGRLTSTIINDLGISKNIPLSGVRVQLKDDDRIADEIFSETYTDEQGYYNMTYDKVQTLLEGTDVELYVYLKSKNEKFDIKTKKNNISGPAFTEKYEMNSVGTNGGNRTKDINTTMSAFRVTSWAVRSWEHAKNNGIRLINGLSILTNNKGSASYFDEHGGKLVGINPGIFLRPVSCDQEGTSYHEFGHFLMWNIQGFTYINVIQKSSSHSFDEENTSRLAWSEGWADAHEMIMDASHYWEDDEYGYKKLFSTTALFENRLTNYQMNKGGQINNGLWSEYYIACAIYDLWDGPGKGVPLRAVSSGPFVGFNDELTGGWDTEDDVELSFSQIVQPIIDNSGLLTRLLSNINQYYVALLSKSNDCIYQNKISKAFSENRVVFNITDYEQVRGYGVMASGGISQQVTVHLNGIGQNGSKRTYEDNYLLTFLMDVSDITLDHKFFPNMSDIISDYITLGFDPGLKTNLDINIASGLNHVVVYYDPNYQSGTLSTCGLSGIEVKNGTVNVGGVGTGYTANLVVNDLGIVRTDSKGILNINQGSNLIVKSGGTLFIRSGSTVNLDGKIIVESGGYICIENGATLNFSQQSELHIDQNAIININPVLGSISHNCSNALSACANLTGNNTGISVIPYISLPLSADINLRTGNSTVLRAGAAGLHFDGIDDYIAGGSISSFPDQGAITFWMNPSIVENYRNPFSTTDFNGGIRFEESTVAPYGFVALFGNETGFGGFWQRHVYLGVNEMIPNKWYHVIITWDKTRAGGPVVSGYLNGSQKFFEEPQSISNWPTTFPKISIGTGFDASSNRHFQGMMDDVGIYDKYISSQADIVAAMQGSLSTNVLAYWDFNEGTGISTANNSGGNPGTLQNGTSWVTSSTPITYTWTPSIGLSPTTGDLVVANPSSSTTYTVTATASGSCASTSTIQVNVGPNYRLASQDPTQSSIVGIVGSNISAYPNPASGNLTVSVTGGSYKLAILDIQGRVLNEYNSAEETMNINVSNLNTGLYMFQITQNGITTRRKLEIMN